MTPDETSNDEMVHEPFHDEATGIWWKESLEPVGNWQGTKIEGSGQGRYATETVPHTLARSTTLPWLRKARDRIERYLLGD